MMILIEFLKENAWWIGLFIGVLASLYPNEIKVGMKKIFLFLIKPTNTIIGLLLVILIAVLVRT